MEEEKKTIKGGRKEEKLKVCNEYSRTSSTLTFWIFGNVFDDCVCVCVYPCKLENKNKRERWQERLENGEDKFINKNRLEVIEFILL